MQYLLSLHTLLCHYVICVCICMCVRACHLQGLAPLKTLSDGQRKSASSAQPMLKSLVTLQSNQAVKVASFKCTTDMLE